MSDETKIGAFDVFKAMSRRNMDIRLSTLDNIIQLRKVKAGTNVTIGVYGDIVGSVFNGKFVGGLLLADKEQYQAVLKELEAENRSKIGVK